MMLINNFTSKSITTIYCSTAWAGYNFTSGPNDYYIQLNKTTI